MTKRKGEHVNLPDLALDARQLHLLDLIGERGACNTLRKVKTYHYDPFFPPKGGSMAEAKRICADCPVLMECLEFAFDTDQVGFWGGMSELERNRMKRQAS